jgi:hypothetical protein
MTRIQSIVDARAFAFMPPDRKQGVRAYGPFGGSPQAAGEAGSRVRVWSPRSHIALARRGIHTPRLTQSPAEKKVSNFRMLCLTSLVWKLQNWQASEPSAFTVSRR